MSDKIGIYNIKKYAEMDMLVVGDIATPMREGEACNFKRFKLGEWKSMDEELLNNYGANITTEYLANTYGEVKSKEHAEFIKLLAETNGVPCGHKQVDNNCKVFYVIGGVLYFCPEEINASGKYEKITIPLPPELDCKQSKPKKVLSDGSVYELHDDGMYCRNNHYETCTVSFNFSDLETLKEASDFKVIEGEDDKIFKFEGIKNPPKHFDCICTKCGGRCCIGNCDKWPKVNDEVLLDGKKGVVKLPPDAQGYYVVAVDGIYTQCKFGELSKPKTPEQELCDELIDIFESSLDGGHFVDNLLSKYYLTEKSAMKNMDLK